VSTTKRSKFAVLALGLALVAASCGSDKVAVSTPTNKPTPEVTEPKTTTAGATTPVTEATPGDTTAPTDPATVTSDPAAVTGDPKMVITYDINPDAVWDDGSPITVADFECTRSATMTTPGSLSTTGYDKILSVEAGTSDKQVVVTLNDTYAPYKSLFASLIKASAMDDCSDVSASFDGGIPFSGREWKIDSWSAEQLVYVPNDAYWGKRKPLVSKVVVVPAEDGATALKAGTIDFAYPQFHQGLDEEVADPNVALARANGGDFEGLYFQQKKGPFADPIYREAFSRSIDRDALFAQIYAPFAGTTPLLNCGPIVPGNYCTDAFANQYDPAAADTLLTDAGWKKGSDGFWADSSGKVPEIRWMINTGNTRRESTQNYLIPLLADAGFKVKADNCEALPCVFETRLPALDYDLAMFINTVAPDPAYLITYSCKQIPTDENDNKGQNTIGWCNEEASAMLEKADVTIDEDARATLIKDALKLMASDFAMVPLFQFPKAGAHRTDRVANTDGQLNNYRAFNDFYQWEDVDGDGQIVIGAEQYPTSDCANPITECANSSWYVWVVSNPILPSAYDTSDTGYEVTDLLTGEAKVEIL
jgi:peptide/nickel transport system substrate-binding protein